MDIFEAKGIEISGRVSSLVLAKPKNFRACIGSMEDIYAVFVLRQDYDIELGTVFSITYSSQNNIATENNYELVAITQQWDKPFDRIPRGWKTICALKLINNIPAVVK